MRRALYASSGLHFGVLIWALIGGSLFSDTEEEPFELTGVTLISAQEFDAMFETVVATPAVVEQPSLPTPPVPDITEPTPPTPEAAAPVVTPPEATPEPPTETQPDMSTFAPLPDTEVQAEVAALPSPPAQDVTAPPSDTPAPSEAPRVAPLPAPAPPPEAEIAPEVVTRPEPSETPAPVPDTPPTAPEEATTEIVTEAETPAAALAPVTSFRPPARPIRTVAEAPTPDTPPAIEERDPLADAIAAAVAEAASEAPPAPVTPAGPPLSAGQRDGLRLAIGQCWNLGTVSSEAMRTTVVVGFSLSQEGVPDTGSIRLVEIIEGTEAGADLAFEAARRAIIRCGRNGYDLPQESYDHWRNIEAVFNPDGMRMR
ncbi:hypothetical protein [Nioella ostreopsis]|uniref:hypothetical protein n=1 Tax=Nioella ostreopsis TaxID=2448479 RepID=UPI000FD90292|nr:hypothetical protein [Nioella ostreopsis]